MTLDIHTPQGDYPSIRSAAAHRIAEYECDAAKTPFDPKQLGVHARVLRKLLDAHITTDESVGSGCVECGEPWPCGSVRLAFVPPHHLD